MNFEKKTEKKNRALFCNIYPSVYAKLKVIAEAEEMPMVNIIEQLIQRQWVEGEYGDVHDPDRTIG